MTFDDQVDKFLALAETEEGIVVYNSNAREFQKLEEWLEKQNLDYKKR